MAELVDAASFVPVAHAGHWLIYVGPVLIVLIAVIASAVRERRAREAGDDEDLGADGPTAP